MTFVSWNGRKQKKWKNSKRVREKGEKGVEKVIHGAHLGHCLDTQCLPRKRAYMLEMRGGYEATHKRSVTHTRTHARTHARTHTHWQEVP